MGSPERDRRRDKRLELTLPVRFSGKAEEGLTQLTGVTWNVSSGGVFFEAPAGHVQTGDVIWVRISVRSGDEEHDSSDLTLVGTGLVRRVEPLEPNRLRSAWPDRAVPGGVCGVALQFRQRPTVQLHSLESFLGNDSGS
ncbi:MAG: PilZ domain-containing protein [Planctomycetota bacterium]